MWSIGPTLSQTVFALDLGGLEPAHAGMNPSAGGPAMQDNGKYVTIYQRKPADTWRMARDIWNSSNPPPKM